MNAMGAEAVGWERLLSGELKQSSTMSAFAPISVRQGIDTFRDIPDRQISKLIAR